MILKIVQLSDCHLQGDPAATYRGENADRNLQKVWASARTWCPDLVLLTGDLSEDASGASYRRLAAMLETSVPILALPGNHDDGVVMHRYFPRGPWKGPMLYERGNWCIVMTDSTRRGKVGGYFSEKDIDAVARALNQTGQEHLLVALHHQPVSVETPWIDRYPLHDPDRFLDVVCSEPRVRCVLWGHIHHHFATQRDGILMLGAPSTAVNTVPGATRFTADEAGPACRRLELGADGEVVYGQIYAAG